MVEFKSCNWCGKIYRLKKGMFTGLVRNRKYCCKKCKIDAEGQFRYTFLHHPHHVLDIMSFAKGLNAKPKVPKEEYDSVTEQ